MQKLKSHLVRTQLCSLSVLPLKLRVGQYGYMLCILSGISSLVISLLLVNSPAFFPKPLLIFPVLAVANTGSCVGQQNKVGHPVGCRFLC